MQLLKPSHSCIFSQNSFPLFLSVMHKPYKLLEVLSYCMNRNCIWFYAIQSAQICASALNSLLGKILLQNAILSLICRKDKRAFPDPFFIDGVVDKSQRTTIHNFFKKPLFEDIDTVTISDKGSEASAGASIKVAYGPNLVSLTLGYAEWISLTGNFAYPAELLIFSMLKPEFMGFRYQAGQK